VASELLKRWRQKERGRGRGELRTIAIEGGVALCWGGTVLVQERSMRMSRRKKGEEVMPSLLGVISVDLFLEDAFERES